MGRRRAKGTLGNFFASTHKEVPRASPWDRPAWLSLAPREFEQARQDAGCRFCVNTKETPGLAPGPSRRACSNSNFSSYRRGPRESQGDAGRKFLRQQKRTPGLPPGPSRLALPRSTFHEFEQVRRDAGRFSCVNTKETPGLPPGPSRRTCSNSSKPPFCCDRRTGSQVQFACQGPIHHESRPPVRRSGRRRIWQFGQVSKYQRRDSNPHSLAGTGF